MYIRKLIKRPSDVIDRHGHSLIQTVALTAVDIGNLPVSYR